MQKVKNLNGRHIWRRLSLNFFQKEKKIEIFIFILFFSFSFSQIFCRFFVFPVFGGLSTTFCQESCVCIFDSNYNNNINNKYMNISQAKYFVIYF